MNIYIMYLSSVFPIHLQKLEIIEVSTITIMLSKDRNVYRAVLFQVDIHMSRFLRFEVE